MAHRLIPTTCRSVRNCANGWRGGVPGFRGLSNARIDLDTFAAEGRAIARPMKAELPDWSIVYFDDAAAARRNYRGPPSSYEIEIRL
jgi:hypothetical protein